MAKKIDPSLRKVGEYLKIDKSAKFIIPEYQRAYSWKIENCDILWQDINNFIDSVTNDCYFFGTIIISCSNDDSCLSLIDGQQRTTTFLLLLKALLNKINVEIPKTKGDDDAFKLYSALKERRKDIIEIIYRCDREDISEEFSSVEDSIIYDRFTMVENKSINERFKNDLNIILNSIDLKMAESKITIIPFKKNDNKYSAFFRNYKYFCEKVDEMNVSQLNQFAKKFIKECEIIEIKSWNVEQAITMFNSLNAAGLPLSDSDIISSKLYAWAEKKNCSVEYNDLWKSMNDKIADAGKNSIVDIDSILMQLMYNERALNKEILSSSNTISVTTPGLRRYFTEINPILLENPLKFCHKMDKLISIWIKISSYPLTQVLLKFNSNTKLFLASYFLRLDEDSIDENSIESIMNNMLRLFTILELVDAGYSSNYFKTFLFNELLRFVDPSFTDSDITNDFTSHINKNWQKDQIITLIKSYNKNALVYLNEYLVAKENNYCFIINGQEDIEHIMPQSGKDIQTIQRDANIADNNEFYNLVDQLGNKIMLEIKINRSIGNEWFRTKISTHLKDKTGYKDSGCPIARKLVDDYKNTDQKYWTKNDIERETENASIRISNFIFD